MGTIWQDVRYGLRTLARTPGFTVVVVLILAVAIGANTAVFSVVNAVALKPLPYRDAERLLRGEWSFNLPYDRLYEVVQRDDLFAPPEGLPEALSRFEFRLEAFKPRFITAHAAYLDMMRRGVQILGGPYFPRDSQSHQQFRNLAGHSCWTYRLAPMLDLAQEFHCDMVAQVHMTRAGLGLLRYREAHGTFPDSLEALDLEDLVDPFAAAPLHYRTADTGFVVYSVGEDQHDNGGTPRQRRTTSDPRHRTSEYDLIWRFPWSTGRTAGGDE